MYIEKFGPIIIKKSNLEAAYFENEIILGFTIITAVAPLQDHKFQS
jgi:hypothetical protein